MLPRRQFILALVLVAASPWAQAAAAERPTTAELSAFFADVAFGAEYLKSGTPVVQKWLEPIRVSVTELDGRLIDKPGGGKELKLEKAKLKPEHVKLIRKHLGKLLELTGVKSENAKKVGKPPNYFIKFVPRLAMHGTFLVKGVDPALLKRLAAPGVCYFLTAANKGLITWATIVVNNQLSAEAMDACLLEELTQSLGLPNDSDRVKPSIFNNKATSRELNRTDILMIKTLYDNRLPPGMIKKQALRRIPRIVKALDEKLP